MIVVDVIFAAYYNLVTDYRQQITASFVIGKAFSFVAVLMVFGHYLRILEQSVFGPRNLGEVEH